MRESALSCSGPDRGGAWTAPVGGDLENDLWPRLALAIRPLLALDYDGTLVPFQSERMAARLTDPFVKHIERIRDETDTFLAIVSGRPMKELIDLAGLPGLALIGAHGRERRWPDGREERVPPGIEQVACLDRAAATAAEWLPAERIERKIGSVAVHVRGLAEAEGKRRIDAISERWRAGICQGMECRPFDGGIELRVRGQDKGTALRRVVEHARPGLIVYLGDDETDEDAFRFLRGCASSYGIRIGDDPRPTLAHARLRDVDAVAEFLRRWLDVRRSSL